MDLEHDLKAKAAIRPAYPYWTSRVYVNGVVDLAETKLGDSFLEEVITGVMNDLRTWLTGNGCLEFDRWTNIAITPLVIIRATTYGVVASLYARNIFVPRRGIVRTAPMEAHIVPMKTVESAMEHWEAKMDRMLKHYRDNRARSRILVDTWDEEPVFTMDDIPFSPSGLEER